MTILFYSIILLYGIIIGSFMNVCIYRIPRKENIVVVRSHCMNCGYQLKWYDLVPIFSFLFLKGCCRSCKAKLSLQYPLIEAMNGLAYLVIFYLHGFQFISIIYCLLTSALLVLSVIDIRTFEIPIGINIFIFSLGVVRLIFEFQNPLPYIIGLFSVSVCLYLLYIATSGRGIGGGDIKLMAAAGLLLGWKLIILSFILGCIFGSVIHIIRMRITKADHVLALGPYLSAGIWTSICFGDAIINWYQNYLSLL